MVTVLTGASDGERHTLRVPRANAGNLAQTAVGLAGQAGDTPAVNDTLETVTLGDGADVDGLRLLEDGVDADLLLQQRLGEAELGLDVAAVDLDLLDEGLLRADAVVAQLLVLRVRDDADNRGVLLEALQRLLGGSDAGLGLLVRLQLGEGQLGGLLPVLVEAALELGL
jgi:hypothetical protein